MKPFSHQIEAHFWIEEHAFGPTTVLLSGKPLVFTPSIGAILNKLGYGPLPNPRKLHGSKQ